MAKKEYDKEPVYYCTNCLSLAIKAYNKNIDFCNDCGSTAIKRTFIELWEDSYEELHGKKYLEQR